MYRHNKHGFSAQKNEITMVGATYLRYTSMRHMGSDEKKTTANF